MIAVVFNLFYSIFCKLIAVIKFILSDCLEFMLTTDHRNNKLLAVNLTKLPPGSVVIEALGEELCMGRVEVEPKISKNPDSADISTLGRVSYDKSGVSCFVFLSVLIFFIDKNVITVKNNSNFLPFLQSKCTN